MYSVGGEGEEENLLGGMPPSLQTLIYLCCLYRQASGCGGDGYSEKDSHSPCKKVTATLLTDVQIQQE